MFRIATRMNPAHATDQGAPPQAGPAAELCTPRSLVLLSASPRLLQAQGAVLRHYDNHPRLGFELLAAIRLVAARALDAADCQDHTRRLLGACGLTMAEINALPEPGHIFFEAEGALLRFVHLALADPRAVRDRDLHDLRALGWDDAAILDALAHGAGILAPEMLLRALGKVDADRDGWPRRSCCLRKGA